MIKIKPIVFLKFLSIVIPFYKYIPLKYLLIGLRFSIYSKNFKLANQINSFLFANEGSQKYNFEYYLYKLYLDIILFNCEKELKSLSSYEIVINEMNTYEEQTNVKRYNTLLGTSIFSDFYNIKIIQDLLKFQHKDIIVDNNEIPVYQLSPEFFYAIGHIYLLDGLIKCIELGWVKYKKLKLNISKKTISNLEFFDRYIDYMISKDILEELIINDFDSNLKIDNSFVRLIFWCLPDGKFERADKLSNRIHDYWKLHSKNNVFNEYYDIDRYKLNKLLNILGLCNDSKYITLHLRTDEFRNDNINHFYNSRNFDDIQTLIKLNDYLELNNIKVILLGDNNKVYKKISNQKSYINYPDSTIKSTEADFLLLRYSSLHIGSVSGISHVAPILGVRTLFIDSWPVRFSWNHNCVFIPKFPIFLTSNKIVSFKQLTKFSPPIYLGGDIPLKQLNIKLLNADIKVKLSILQDIISNIFLKEGNYFCDFVNIETVDDKDYDFKVPVLYYEYYKNLFD